MLALLLHHGALITGSGLRQYTRAIQLASREGCHSAADLLRASRDWPDQDERSMNVDLLSESAGA
jgi:hypothetical protein